MTTDQTAARLHEPVIGDAISALKLWFDQWADQQADEDEPCECDEQERRVIHAGSVRGPCPCPCVLGLRGSASAGAGRSDVPRL